MYRTSPTPSPQSAPSYTSTGACGKPSPAQVDTAVSTSVAPDATLWLYVAAQYFQDRCAKNDPPYLRQPKANGTAKDRQTKRNHVRRQLEKQGVPLRDVIPQPNPDKPGVVSQSLQWLRGIAQAASPSLPAWPELPDLRQWCPIAWPVAAAQTDPTYVQGRGGVAVATTHFDPARHEPDEASTPEPYRRAIASLVGENMTHQVPMPPPGLPGTPFLANVAIEGPGFVLLHNNQDESSHTARLIRHTVNTIGKYLQSLSVPVNVLSFQANLANVEWTPAVDTLAVADMSEEKALRLWQVFGQPAHLLSVTLDPDCAHSPNGVTLGFDQDMQYRAVESSHPGKTIALVFEPCIKDARYATPITDLTTALRAAYHALQHWRGQRFAQLLESLGFVVVRVSAQDHARLALNFVATGVQRGRLLFTRSDVSEALVQQLLEHGVTPVLPVDGQQLGHIGSFPDKSAFGVKCTSFTLPEAAGASPLVAAPEKDKPMKVDT